MDTSLFQTRMDAIIALSEQSNKLLDELLNDIDPQWREHEAERKAAKVAQKAARKAGIINKTPSTLSVSGSTTKD